VQHLDRFPRLFQLFFTVILSIQTFCSPRNIINPTNSKSIQHIQIGWCIENVRNGPEKHISQELATAVKDGINHDGQNI
jgi:hypothetical protein